METPFANAASRGCAFMPVPMMLACISLVPKDSTYLRAIGPITDAEPASESPNPSRIDFFPSSITSAGMSSYFVLTINSAVDLVRPGAFGNSAAAGVAAALAAGEASTLAPAKASADAASEFLNRSRRFMGDPRFPGRFNSSRRATIAPRHFHKYERHFPCRFSSALLQEAG